MSIKEDFKFTDQASWKKLISKALKINSLDEFQGRTIQGVEIPSFNHPSEEKIANRPLKTSDSEWKIGFSIDLDRASASEGVLTAVENGSEALILKGKSADWNLIYKGIYHEMIYNDLRLEGGATTLKEFISYSIDAGKNLSSLQGSIDLSIDTLKANVDDLQKLPAFHFTTIQVKAKDIPSELAQICVRLQEALEACLDADLSHKRIRVATQVDAHLPVNVSKMRAIRIIWANLLQAYKLTFHPLFLVANTKVDASANKETKLIHHTLASVNAAIGTADLICATAQEDLNADRLNQNIQHIMKMESKLNQVRDPLAGSYSIEKMSQHLAKAAWDSMVKNAEPVE